MKKLFTITVLLLVTFSYAQIEQFAVYPGCPTFSKDFDKKKKNDQESEQKSIMDCAVRSMQADLNLILRNYDLENNYQTANLEILRATARFLVNENGVIEKAHATAGNKHFQRAVVSALYELSDKLKTSNRYFTAAKKPDGTATSITLTLPLDYVNAQPNVSKSND